MTQPGALTSNAAFVALRNRVEMLERRATSALTTAKRADASAAVGAATNFKRFRIGVFTMPLTHIGEQVVGVVKWSSPITNAAGQPVDAYNVDAACSAISASLTPTFSEQTSTGVTVTFTSPVLMTPGSIVVVLGIAPATT